MNKILLVVPAILLLAGCQGDTRITVEDNGPTQYEREEAMTNCVGVIRSIAIKNVEESLRIACTQAVYGGYN